MYETRISLRYPTGRVHEETLSTWNPVEVGSQFELYGHTWRVVALTSPQSRFDHKLTRLVCEIADAARAA